MDNTHYISMSRDNYFQACWLTLRAMNPRMAKLMNQIEAETFGIKTSVKTKPRKVDKDADNKQKPMVV